LPSWPLSVKNFLYIKSLGNEDANGIKMERPKLQLPKFCSSSGQSLKPVGAHILLLPVPPGLTPRAVLVTGMTF